MFIDTNERTGEITVQRKHFIVAILLFIAVVMSFGSFFTVDQGTVAMTKTFGEINDKIFEPGLHFKTPIIDSVVRFNIQTNKDQATATASSKDLQNVNTELAVNYNIEKSQVKQIYSNLGDFELVKDKVVTPAIQEIVKAVTAKYTAEELITKRNQISLDITAGLKEKLSTYGLNVVDVNIINFQFSAGFDASIEAKVKAEQDALAQKNVLEKVKYEAQQQIETARAQAESIKIQAEAISKQGGPEYVKLKRIEQRDGRLPSTTLSNATPMINISE